MEKEEIVKELAQAKTVEKIINNVNKGSIKQKDILQDLAQDIYYTLLTKDNLSEIYEKGELDYYISRIVINLLKSTNSPFYYTYRKNNKNNIPIYGLEDNI